MNLNENDMLGPYILSNYEMDLNENDMLGPFLLSNYEFNLEENYTGMTIKYPDEL